jgi:phosphatidate phosphatase LPIN
MLYKESLPDEKIQELISKQSLFGKNYIIDISKIIIENFDEEKIINDLVSKKAKDKINKYKKKYRSFYPSSNQLKKLKLNLGRNEITFVCRESISGIHTLKCFIYLWHSSSKLIISDVDGTITKSDVLGQVLPIIGKDWSQNGITDLFTNIVNNGYKIIYLTARAICQSELTRDYIETLFQEKKGLPPGPIIMSPDGLFSSFKREVIDKTPQILKITTLTEIRTLFPKKYNPFYAGFGNRENDAVAYRSVGIDMGKIFIVNSKGDLMRLNSSDIISYGKLNENVNEIFPDIRSK